jgi:hypothetical protein
VAEANSGDWFGHRPPEQGGFPQAGSALLEALDAARNLVSRTSKPYVTVAVAAREKDRWYGGVLADQSPARTAADLATFTALVNEWQRDTMVLSGMDIEGHPAYLKIVGMGRIALPLILEELKRNGGHWFWALEAISRENPANRATTVPQATSAWLEWGRDRGLID